VDFFFFGHNYLLLLVGIVLDYGSVSASFCVFFPNSHENKQLAIRDEFPHGDIPVEPESANLGASWGNFGDGGGDFWGVDESGSGARGWGVATFPKKNFHHSQLQKNSMLAESIFSVLKKWLPPPPPN
jgi:hypothetical protein